MTSGADHLTGNLEPWELVYWSSSTNLEREECTHHYATVWFHSDDCSTPKDKTVKRVESARHYLVIPKSDTFTSLFLETRQFLAACRTWMINAQAEQRTRTEKWWFTCLNCVLMLHFAFHDWWIVANTAAFMALNWKQGKYILAPILYSLWTVRDNNSCLTC